MKRGMIGLLALTLVAIIAGWAISQTATYQSNLTTIDRTTAQTLTVNATNTSEDRDPSLVLKGGTGAAASVMTLTYDGSAYDLHASATAAGVNVSGEFVVGPPGSFSSTALDLDPSIRLKGHASGDAVSTYTEATIAVDSSADNLVITPPSGGSVVVAGALSQSTGNWTYNDATGDFSVTSDNFTVASDNTSSISTTGAGLTVQTVTSGTLTVTSAGALDLNAVSATLDTSGAFSVDGASASNVSVTGGNLTVSTIASGDLILASAAAVDVDSVTATIDTSGAFSIDGAGASNVTVASANLTLSTTTTGNVVVSSAAAVDIDGVSATLDTSGAFSVDGASASNVSVTGGNLTLSTITSGDLLLTTADQCTVTVADNISSAFLVQQGANAYLDIATSDSSEAITLGNATTNPTLTLAGTGDVTIGGVTVSTWPVSIAALPENVETGVTSAQTHGAYAPPSESGYTTIKVRGRCASTDGDATDCEINFRNAANGADSKTVAIPDGECGDTTGSYVRFEETFAIADLAGNTNGILNIDRAAGTGECEIHILSVTAY